MHGWLSIGGWTGAGAAGPRFVRERRRAAQADGRLGIRTGGCRAFGLTFDVPDDGRLSTYRNHSYLP